MSAPVVSEAAFAIAATRSNEFHIYGMCGILWA